MLRMPPAPRATRRPGTEIRRLILDTAKRAGVGHIGSALSIADIAEVLVRDIARRDGAAQHRDVVVLSKGHAALAYYCALHLAGEISDADLDSYCTNGSHFGVHPDHHVEGIDFSTGSLGHGLSWGAGVALGMRMRQAPYRTFVVLSDAELDEGSTWEALMFAGHHRLDRLTAVLDENGQQALGRTHDVLRLDGALRAVGELGWDVAEVDGHDQEALRRAMGARATGRPRFIRAHTVSGSGVPFMEGEVAWHYLPMSDAQYEAALAAVDAWSRGDAVEACAPS